MSAQVISVNTGHGQEAGWAGRVGRTAIDKRPRSGPVTIGRLGAADDEQVDERHHGGPDQALYVYAREDLDWWTEQLGRELPNGVFGENITSAGLDVSGALIGETWRLGTAVVQIASVRIPCGTFAGWMGERAWVKRFAAAGRPGAYLRVLEEGVAGAGDPLVVLSRPPDSVTVAEAMRAYYGDIDLVRRLLDAPGLHPGWQEMAVSMLGRAARADTLRAEARQREAQRQETLQREAAQRETLRREVLQREARQREAQRQEARQHEALG